MDIAIIHNFTEHLGGGDLVALDILETLLEKDHTIDIYTSYPKGVSKAIEIFDKDPRITENTNVIRVEVPKLVRHPYNIYFITKKMLNKLKEYSLVIFFDDIPKLAQELKKIFVYVHYPHAARIILYQLVPYRYRNSIRGKMVWRAHSILFKQCFLMNWDKPNIYVATNSTLTYEHVVKALKPRYVVKIYPPVQVEKIIEYVKKLGVEKEDLAVYVGRIQPEKGIEDIIEALRYVERRDVKVRIIGFGFDDRYLQYLKNRVRSLGLDNRVEFRINAPRNEVVETLARAKVLIHPAHYEPFGIAVVEGMATGCIPIVRKGMNGPWIDIVDEGRFGLGFENPKELAFLLDLILNRNNSFRIIDEIFRRVIMFSEKTFKQKLINYLNSILP